jgi:hypothetical protein
MKTDHCGNREGVCVGGGGHSGQRQPSETL